VSSSFKAAYLVWIKERYTTQESAYGKCSEATNEMQEEFPELMRVRGHYYCHVWGERDHWWLITSDGRIVDPTAIQFPSKGHGAYVEFDESTHEEPTGRCPNCGEYCYNGRTCCCDACHSSYAAYVMNPD